MKILSTDNIPAELAAGLVASKKRFCERNDRYRQWFDQCMQDQHFAAQLDRVWLGSEYAVDVCCRYPDVFQQLVTERWFEQDYNDQTMADNLSMLLAAAETVPEFDRVLRQNRTREMLRIIWRDINRIADMQHTTRDMSLLAAASIQQALDFHHQQLQLLYGSPMMMVDGHPVEQQMLVIGMGKLGAWELNLSSDIDLIFAYPKGGVTEGGKKSLDNSEFFTRLARKLIQSLDAMTADGFVFRVDMRLRPYGQSGALVMSFNAMEDYYQRQGRDWERYAMIKARVVAGDEQQAALLTDLLRPFTYRRYIDFSAIDALRSMKKMIQEEVKRRQLNNDVKLGAGGIREIEFIAQCFQLIRGGKEVELQQRGLQPVLALLEQEGQLPSSVVAELQQAYVFLRNTEHALQCYQDKQTQTLPVDAVAQSTLAFVMGFESWDLFLSVLQQHRSNVSRHFNDIIADEPEQLKVSHVDVCWLDLWQEVIGDEQAVALLQQAGHEAASEVVSRLRSLRQSTAVKHMQRVGRERLDQFMPLLLQAVLQVEQPSASLLRVLLLVDAVLRRTAYLVLLVENPNGLERLIKLCAASPWIAAQLARHPVLLDELLDSDTLYQVLDKAALRDELQQQMLRLAPDDLEGQMEALRYFKLVHHLQIAAAEVTGKLPLMKVSDYLTMIAEVVLDRVLDIAWDNLTAKHGYPQKAPDQPCNKDFIIVAYGKLGGIELGHGSDLDLVFIHGAALDLPTDGMRPIDSSLFFARLGQRIVHILTAQTSSGILYEVDMRLRPSGNSGLLVSSIKVFDDYQQQRAWTWEHQALVRARVVSGDPVLAQAFEALRRRVLCKPRDEQQLRVEVVTMRQKMRDHLLPKGLEQGQTPIFHLKHGRGAIVDIEFMVQYAVLVWSHQHPTLSIYTDNIRILEALKKEGLFSIIDAEALTKAYQAYRTSAHRLSLQQQPNQVPMAQFEQHRQAVLAIWQRLMEE
ncbi:MAG: bifunctional [glutamate--ammonia ligase]-adenylyl-L-tyrosine phosphorylase/[glutamate--ammonia-ligase] adenylyltransferase [Spongiibacteraceae bacterium]